MSKKLVLVYGFGDEEEALCRLVEEHHVAARPVASGELDETIGALCGMPGFPRKETGDDTPLDGAMLIFSGLSQKALDHLLKAISKAGLKTQALKAMVTETNRSWTLRSLGGEIHKEHQVMNALIDLKKFRDSIENPNFLDLKLMTAMFQVDRLLSGTVEVELPDIFQARKNLEDALKG